MFRSLSRPVFVSFQTGKTIQVDERGLSIPPDTPLNPSASQETPSPAIVFNEQILPANARVVRKTGVEGKFQ